MQNELYHHGIKGMKWGVRRYQNKDGSLTSAGKKQALRRQKDINKQANKAESRSNLTRERTIPAGTKMYRTSVNPNERLEGSTYVSYLDVDRNHYNGGWIRKTGGAKKAYEYEFELKDDLRIPSREEQRKVINEVVNSNKKHINEVVKSYVDQIIPKGSWDYYEMESYYKGGVKGFTKEIIDGWKDKTPEEAAYTVCQSLGLAPNVKKEIISKLKNKGYNAMTDEASIGGQNGWSKEGYDPLIIFDSSSLTNVNKKTISSRKETKAHMKDMKWQRKARTSSAEWSNKDGVSL